MNEIRKIGAFVSVSAEIVEDCPDVWQYIERAMERQIDRKLHPWKYPDRPMWWDVQWFPAPVERLLAWIDRRFTR